jgi:hypothetical protein
MRPYLEKKLSQKRAGGVAQGISPEFKPQCGKKRKQKPNKQNKTIRRGTCTKILALACHVMPHYVMK